MRHAQLSNGELYYNDQKSPLEADLHDLTFQAGFDPAATKLAMMGVAAKPDLMKEIECSNPHVEAGRWVPNPARHAPCGRQTRYREVKDFDHVCRGEGQTARISGVIPNRPVIHSCERPAAALCI